MSVYSWFCLLLDSPQPNMVSGQPKTRLPEVYQRLSVTDMHFAERGVGYPVLHTI